MAYIKGVWVDEVLPSPPRYDILEDGGGAFKSSMQIDQIIIPTLAGSVFDAAKMNNIEGGIENLSNNNICAYNTETVIAGNVSAVLGQIDDLTISGMTANRDWNLPTPTLAGQLCAVRVLDDAPAAYDLIIKANAVELNRLFYSGESLVFRSTGTGAGDWEVAEGGYGINELYLPIGTYIDVGLISTTAFPFGATISDVHRVIDFYITIYNTGAAHDVSNYYTVEVKNRPDGGSSAADILIATTTTATIGTYTNLLNIPLSTDKLVSGFILIKLTKVLSPADIYPIAPMALVRKRP